MSTRAYAMRQNSFFRVDEWNFLLDAVVAQDVQEYLAKGAYAKARALLSVRFLARFKEPSPGETEEAYKKCHRFAKKGRKETIVRIRAKTQDEWVTRMKNLNNVRLFPYLS